MIQKKSPGDSRLITSAADWNAMADAASYVQQLQLGEGGGPAAVPLRTDIIRIKNGSGANRRKGEILKIGSFLLADSQIVKDGREQLRFNTAIHDGTDAPFCVLIEPIPNNGRGRAQISGVCPALVNITQSGQTFARPKASDDLLQGDALGQVRILHKPTGTGEKECLVLLGDGRFTGFGVPPNDIPKGQSGTVNFYTGLGGAEAHSGITVTAWAKFSKLVATKLCTLVLMNNVLYGLPAEC